MTAEIRIPRPDDWHQHLRDGEALQITAEAAKDYGRFVAMPNLEQPIVNVKSAGAYRERILEALPTDCSAQPLIPLYCTEQLDRDTIKQAAETSWIPGVKLYPANATTNSQDGVHDLDAMEPILEAMQKYDLPLMAHAATTDPKDDVFDREALFIEHWLEPWVKDFPNLRIVIEHVTTKVGVDFVKAGSERIAASITPHHLLCNRNVLFEGGLRPGLRSGLRPHYYCLPILKSEPDRQALLRAARDHPRCFMGSDSAPHAEADKLAACGCAGVFQAPWAVQLCAEALEQVQGLASLEEFVSGRGADFYGFPRSNELCLLQSAEPDTPDAPNTPYREMSRIPESLEWPVRSQNQGQSQERGRLIPFRAKSKLRWRWAPST